MKFWNALFFFSFVSYYFVIRIKYNDPWLHFNNSRKSCPSTSLRRYLMTYSVSCLHFSLAILCNYFSSKKKENINMLIPIPLKVFFFFVAEFLILPSPICSLNNLHSIWQGLRDFTTIKHWSILDCSLFFNC